MEPLRVRRPLLGILYTSTGYAEEQRLRFVTLNEIDNFIRLLLHLRAAGFVLQQFADGPRNLGNYDTLLPMALPGAGAMRRPTDVRIKPWSLSSRHRRLSRVPWAPAKDQRSVLMKG
jgi:hypothetical protein